MVLVSRGDTGVANTSNLMKHLKTCHRKEESTGQPTMIAIISRPYRVSGIFSESVSGRKNEISTAVTKGSQHLSNWSSFSSRLSRFAEAELRPDSPSCGGPAPGGRCDSSSWTGFPPRRWLEGLIAATRCESASCSAPGGNKQGRQGELTCDISSLKALHHHEHDNSHRPSELYLHFLTSFRCQFFLFFSYPLRVPRSRPSLGGFSTFCCMNININFKSNQIKCVAFSGGFISPTLTV